MSLTRHQLFNELHDSFPSFQSPWQKEPNWIEELGYIVMSDFMRFFREAYYELLKHPEKTDIKQILSKTSKFIDKYLKHGDEDVSTMIQLEFLETLISDYSGQITEEDYNRMKEILGGEAEKIIDKYYAYPSS